MRDFSTCEAALTALTKATAHPEVIILDLGLPGMSGLEGLRLFKKASPQTEILIFTVFDDRERVFEAICAGASGYLLKSESLERIVAAVREVKCGGAPMTPEIARIVLDRFSRMKPAQSAIELSTRERDLLRLLADGLTKKEIADQLALSLHTVDNYLRRIYGKLHVNTLGGAVAKVAGGTACCEPGRCSWSAAFMPQKRGPDRGLTDCDKVRLGKTNRVDQ